MEQRNVEEDQPLTFVRIDLDDHSTYREEVAKKSCDKIARISDG